MKKIPLITLSIFMLFILSLSSCTKDEIETTGKLNLSFYNHSLNMKVQIRAIENTDIILNTLNVDTDGNVSVDLNPGNYSITVSESNNTYYSPTGFQIKVGQTTSIVWGSNNKGIVR